MASSSLEGRIKKKKKKRKTNEALQRIETLLEAIKNSDSAAANPKNPKPPIAIFTKPPFGQREVVTVETIAPCRHSCELHIGWMDPHLWCSLPRDLLELVFARLPLATIVELCKLSSQWSALSRSPHFIDVFTDRFPKLFELVGRSLDVDVVYNVTCSEPPYQGGIGRGGATRPFSSMDPVNETKQGGLVCFAPRQRFSTVPILVGDPGMDEWTALPCIPFVHRFTNLDPAVVQLVVHENARCYRLIAMFYNVETKYYAAYCFHSRRNLWRYEESSLVHGNGCSRLLMPSSAVGVGVDHRDFDLRTKMLFELVHQASLKGDAARVSAMVENRKFVLCHPESRKQ